MDANSTLQNILDNLLHVVLHRITRLHQLEQQHFGHQFAFFRNRVWIPSRPMLIFYVTSHFSWMCLLGFSITNLGTLPPEPHNAKEISNKSNFKAKKWTTWCAVHANCVSGSYYFNIETAEESNTIKCWTFTSGQRLTHSYRMIFQSWIDLNLTSRVLFVPLSMKFFRVHG